MPLSSKERRITEVLRSIILSQQEWLASKDQLLKDLRDMFLADEKYSSIEKAVFLGLRWILK